MRYVLDYYAPELRRRPLRLGVPRPQGGKPGVRARLLPGQQALLRPDQQGGRAARLPPPAACDASRSRRPRSGSSDEQPPLGRPPAARSRGSRCRPASASARGCASWRCSACPWPSGTSAGCSTPTGSARPYLYGMLIAAEIFNLIQALGFWWTCANERVRKPKAPSQRVAVDVFVPVYKEPVDIVDLTVAAAARPARRRGPGLGAGRRQRRRHARPGRALRRRLHPARRAHRREGGQHQQRADADQRAVHRGLRLRPRGGPALPRGHARVHGGPRDRVRADAAVLREHATGNRIAAASWAQQALFFGAIARGKDGLDAVFCCGTNVLFRREAFESVGGFPTNSLTEDFELSIRLHERGWKSAYVPDVLSRGLGPEDMAAYVSQQQRWARGCLSGLPRALRAKLPLKHQGAVPALGLVLPVRVDGAHLHELPGGAAALRRPADRAASTPRSSCSTSRPTSPWR